MYKGDKGYIFISYAHKDSEVVMPIINGLEEKGFRLWYDTGIEAGTEWPEFIAEKLMNSNVVIAFISKNSIASHNCRREINFTIEIKKELLVVYLEDLEMTPGMRLQLNSLQAIFKNRSPDLNSFLEKLCNAELLKQCMECVQADIPEKQNNNEEQISTETKKWASEQNGKNDIASKSVVQKDENTVLNAIMQYKINHKTLNSFHICNKAQLTPKQMKNAMETYANDVKVDDIVAMIDTTIMQSGKEGYLFTDSTLYYSYLKEKGAVSLRDIKSISVINDRKINIDYHNGTSTTAFIISLYTEEICGVLKNIASKNYCRTDTDQALEAVSLAICVAENNSNISFKAKFRHNLTIKQIINAIKNYATDVTEDEVIAILDTTLMQSGKEGFLFTKSKIYYSWKSNGGPVNYAEIKSVKKADRNYLQIEFKNGDVKKYYYSIYSNWVYNFLNELLNK